MKKTYLPAETWDRMQYLFRSYYDGMMHAVFYYDSELDKEVLVKAYTEVITRIPVLHSSYEYNPVKPRWRVNEVFSADDFFSFIETDSPEEETEKFITRRINPKSVCQIRIGLIRSAGKDTLCVVQNHMCADGGDFKIFNAKIAEYYSALLSGTQDSVVVKNGTRAATQIYDTMPPEKAEKAKALYKNVSNVPSKVRFPFARPDNDVCRILRRRLSAESFANIRKNGKAMGATVNDILLAAYILAVYKMTTPADGVISVPNMIDMRRHIEGGQTAGFTNMTGFMPCSVKVDPKDNLEDVIKKVQISLEPSKKDEFVGLYGLPLLTLAFKIFPQAIAETAIRIGYQNPLIGMSNIGLLNQKDYAMGDKLPYYAWYTGAIKYKPYIQLAATTFMGEITFSVAVRCNEEDCKIIDGFYNILFGLLGQLDY